MVVTRRGNRGWSVVVAGACVLLVRSASAQPAPAPPPAPAPAPAPAELPAPPADEVASQPEEPPAEEVAPQPEEPPAEGAAPAEEPPAEEPPADEPPADEPPAEAVAPAPEEDPVPEPSYRVPEEDWEAALEQKVTVETDAGEPLHGTLVASTPAAAVVVGDDGNVHTLQKAQVVSLTIDPPEPSDEVSKPPAEESPPDGKEPSETDWKKFGIFTSHGISYAHWRTSLYRAGSVAYAGDLGVGYNWSRPWGAYLVLGGNAGARLVDRTIKANFGHLAGMIRYRGKKRFVGMGGLALAWSKLDEPTRRVRDISISIPLKVMATFEIAKATYIGVGIGYEPGFFAQGRIANALSFQATLAHW